MDNLVEKFKQFGFNSYECKVYIALLKKYPATGYEVSQLANIPQSRAYDALKSLEAQNIVIGNNEKPQKFTPIAPKELTQRLKRKTNSAIDYLEKRLPDVKENYDEPIHTSYEYENAIKKIKEIINNAKDSLFFELWSEDYKQLEGEIAKAYERGIDIKIVGYNNLDSIYATVYYHDHAKEIERSFGSRLIYMLADNSESVFGKVEKQVIWTKNDDIAILIKEFIVHDMYLIDVYKNFPEQLKYFYGPGFKKLKDKVLDRKSGFNIH